MKMKYFSLLMLMSAMLAFTAACSDEDARTSEVVFKPVLPSLETGEELTLNSGTYTFTNVSTGLVSKVELGSATTVIPDGLYNVSFIGKASYNYDPTESKPEARTLIMEVTVQGARQNVEVKGGVCELSLKLTILNSNAGDNFIIAEVFVAGTLNKATNKQYNGDQYFRIRNNSSKTLYAGGLVLLESTFMTVTKNDYTPDIMDKALTVQVVAQIPGDETSYPVLPGQDIIICDNAINHKEANPASADLSKAHFEWFTNSTSASNPDVDNPDVPNLNMIYNYTKTLWMLNKQGNRAYAIGRFPDGISGETYLTKYTYEYTYTMANGLPSDKKIGYYFPNEWIIDAVNLSPKNKYVWNLTSTALDMGYTYIGLNATITENYGKAVVRKVTGTIEGREVLQDTNNSSVDFEPAVRATLLPAE